MYEKLSQCWSNIQSNLFPWMKEELGVLTDKHYQVISILEVSRIELAVRGCGGTAPVGRPESDRRAIARAFVAKSVLNLSTTRQLLDRLQVDVALRRICGWERKSEVPSESVFSRAFAQFAESCLPTQVHEALIKHLYGDTAIVGHLSRDATEIEARERPVVKEKEKKAEQEDKKIKRGRPKKGEVRAEKEPTQVQRQLTMKLPEMLEALPTACDVGTKRNSKGFQESWIGYKLHIDSADGQIPISCILTSASVHDSQVAIPLATLSQQRVINLYDLMDAAYDSPAIHEYSKQLGHVPIIDENPRRNAARKQEILDEKKRLQLIHFELPETARFRNRSNAERVNSQLKDNFGGRTVRVRGNAKVACHLMFGVLALTAHQALLGLAT